MQKIVYMNIAKAIGIVLVVAGHSFTEDSSSPIRSFIYLFHVPFFFMISGYFFNVKYINQPKVLIFKRIKSLWLPFFIWSTLFILLHNFFFILNIYNSEIGFRGGGGVEQYSVGTILEKIMNLFFFKGSEQLLGGFWFLPCLFFTTMIFLFYNVIQEKINNKYVVPALCSVGFVVGSLSIQFDLYIPLSRFNLKLFLITSFMFYLGFLFKKIEHLLKFNLKFSLLFFTILVCVNHIDYIKINSINSVIGRLDLAVIYLIITPVLGAYVLIYIAKLLGKCSLSSYISSIGDKTIVILALHFLCFKLINYIIVIVEGSRLTNLAFFPVVPDHESWFLAYTIVGIGGALILNFLYVNIQARILYMIREIDKNVKFIC